ncbi:MAG TPA: hypothetical protein DCM64_01685 [Gammaproteobacteria bacterium]|nr:hypothetical protein [Gammaproteobacteria bacterium]|tara:strand:- start:1127 stop:1531 length:405 start_codon:yes stop_codon:yes gene_type:complete
MSIRRILVIDDDFHDLEALVRTTRAFIKECSIENIVVDGQSTLSNAMDLLNSYQDFELIICDLHLPDNDIFDVLNYSINESITTPLLLVTGIDHNCLETTELIGRIEGVNILGCFCKPLLPQHLQEVMLEANLL